MIPEKRESCPWLEADGNIKDLIYGFNQTITKLLPEYQNRYSRMWLHSVDP